MNQRDKTKKWFLGITKKQASFKATRESLGDPAETSAAVSDDGNANNEDFATQDVHDTYEKEKAAKFAKKLKRSASSRGRGGKRGRQVHCTI